MSLERATRELTMWINSYYGDMIWLVLMCFSIIYLFVQKRKYRDSFIYPTLFIICLLCNVVFYQQINEYLIYWRLFWMLPTSILIALATINLIKCNSKNMKYIVIFVVTTLVLCLGTRVFNESIYTNIQNSSKVSLTTKKVCDLILDDNPYPLCIFPSDMYSEVRQYSGDIRLIYGRNAEGYIGINSERASELALAMEKIANQPITAAQVARCSDCQYVVLKQECNEFEKYGYNLFGVEEGYYIYRDELDIVPQWTFTLHVTDSSRFVRIQDAYYRNSYIVDGRWGDSEDIKEIVLQYGNVAYDWMTTSMRDSFCAASANMTQESNGVIFFNKYRPEITDVSYDKIVEENDLQFGDWEKGMWENIANWNKKVSSDEEIEFAGLRLTLYNNDDMVACSRNVDVLSDASLVFKLTGQQESVLYVSNVTEKQLEKIIDKYQDSLKADYLIIRNDHIKDFSSLIQVVGTTTVYNYSEMKEDVSIEIE